MDENFHSLILLDNFILALNSNNHMHKIFIGKELDKYSKFSNNDFYPSNKWREIKEMVNNLLKVLLFLYGGSSSSLIDKSLCLLDNARENSIIPVRLVRANKSGRYIILVREISAVTNIKNKVYICSLGLNRKSWRNNADEHLKNKSINVAYNCSCLFFHEQIKHDRYALCKHLLASRIAIYMDKCNYVSRDNKNISYHEEVFVTEDEFVETVVSTYLMSE